MSIEANKAVVRRLYEAVNQRRFDLLDEILAPHYQHRSSAEYQLNRDQLKEATINIGLAAMPDLQASLDEIIAEGDKVMVRWTQRGTHLGSFLGIRATGRQISYSGINIFEVVDGQIVCGTPYWDFEIIRKQLQP